MKRQFTAVYRKEGRWYAAYVEEIPGVNTQGRTLKEARENLKDALKEILTANHELSVRTQKKARREPVMVEIPA